MLCGMMLLVFTSALASEWGSWREVANKGGITISWRTMTVKKATFANEDITSVQFKAENSTSARKSVYIENIRFFDLEGNQIDKGSSEMWVVRPGVEYKNVAMPQKAGIRRVEFSWRAE